MAQAKIQSSHATASAENGRRKANALLAKVVLGQPATQMKTNLSQGKCRKAEANPETSLLIDRAVARLRRSLGTENSPPLVSEGSHLRENLTNPLALGTLKETAPMLTASSGTLLNAET